MDLNNFCYLGDQFQYNLGNVNINSKYFSVKINQNDLINHIVKTITEALKISINQFNKDKFVVNADLTHFELKHVDKELIAKLVSILENLFPEKLEICYIKGASGFFKNVYRYCLSVFLNNRTKSKIRFYKKNGTLSNTDQYFCNYEENVSVNI